MNIYGYNLAKMQYLIYPLYAWHLEGLRALGMDDAPGNFDKYDKAYLT